MLEEQMSNDNDLETNDIETKDVPKEKIINMSTSGEHQELQHASDMSGDSYTSAIRVDVFLQATPLSNRASSQHRMIKKLRLFQVLGALWVFSTLILQGMYEWAFDFPKLIFFQATGKTVHWVLFCIELLGIMVLNSVSLAVVANYVTQCEMMLFYIRGLALRLQEKSSDLRIAMKDVLSVRQNLSVLNGPMARMTSLICVIFCELTIIGISILVLNKNDLPKIWLYRTFFPMVFFIMLCFPLFQAARVNSVCSRIIKIALEMRVFGYKGSSQLDLDSFMNFVSNTKLRVR
ncbi:unnamed protein product [Mytilus edulis]|uniref:Uncharacterized protein n=1 Tax=Mytilus edulis TaxID=6550 RepID=A0A8S3Q6S9_MYTED|nr:unnamed protein product [Mytilus edulis]